MTHPLRFSTAADDDVAGILDHSEREFGPSAALRYAELLSVAFLDLAADPGRVGVKDRPELGPGVLSWHLAGSRHHTDPSVGRVSRPRHIVIFRLEAGTVAVGRVLHDSMEPARHLDEWD